MKIFKKTILSPFYPYQTYEKIKKIEKSLNNIDINKSLTNNLYKQLFLTSEQSGLNHNTTREKKVTISLTSYSSRIKDVYLTIESIMQQSVKADNIVLWLAEDKFNNNNIPASLLKQRARGLTIHYCKDIKSYKKLIPSLKYFSNDIIITIDDDTLYPIDFLEGLYNSYIKNPEYMHCYRARLIPQNSTNLYNYKKWKYTENEKPSKMFLPIGIGGILYTKNKLNKNIFDEKLFMSLAPKADDIWFKAMSLLQSIEIKIVNRHKSFNNEFIEIPQSQTIALHKSNLDNSSNDLQIKKVFKYFDLKNQLKG